MPPRALPEVATMKRFLYCFSILLFSAVALFAQHSPTATLTGKVMTEGITLPGVTVTVASPSLQGTRSTVTSEAGDYKIPFLPPGEYTVTYELAGMKKETRKVTLTVARTEPLDVKLRPSALEEAITVTAETAMTAAVESTQVSTNFRQTMIEQLPIQRNLEAIVTLSPGVAETGPSDAPMISGSLSHDNLWLVNGAVVNENLRGRPHDLFIEDAIEETTVLTAGISAEYGLFTGGVINTITKSGGNEIKGSLRDSLTNDSWTEPTRFTQDQADELNHVYEGTVGGPFLRDRLWFFGAGRITEFEEIRQTRPSTARAGDQDANGNPIALGTVLPAITYPFTRDEKRWEGKLTGAITPRHNVVVSYLNVDEAEHNQTGQTVLDLDSLVGTRELPNSLLGVIYNASFTDRFFFETQYSEKEFAFEGSGSSFYDLIRGTTVIDRLRGARYNTPTFKVTEKGEQRNSEMFTVTGNYFWSTQNLGSHDIKLGYEDFSEVRDVNNWQSGSDYSISIEQTIIRGTQVFPRVRSTQSGSSQTRITWFPIFVLSSGSDYQTQSIFMNDKWNLSDRWSFNLGARFDKNDAVGGAGLRIGDDSAISPRLAVHYDVRGDGRFIANATYGQYVGRLAEGAGNDGDPAGRTATFIWDYRGPAINSNVNTPTSQLVPTHQALQMIFDWFFANGGTDRRPLRSSFVPGVDTILDPNGLKSPNVKEWTIGLGSAMGARGYVRADAIFRTWDDFYEEKVDLTTGRAHDEFGNEYDLSIITNSDIYEREYTGVQSQFSWRLMPKLSLGGTYTWSRLIGNITGENTGNGPITEDFNAYPEYSQESWNFPMGYLSSDRRHRAHIWASYDLPTPVGDFNVSLLQAFEAGGRISTDGTIEITDFVTNPGYLDPPETQTYFFGGRGNFRMDDVTRTDLSINYVAKLFGNRVQIFLQPEIINLFNEDTVVDPVDTVFTSNNADYLAPFDPFHATPIECPKGAAASTCEEMGANYQLISNYGEANSEGDFQTPRTYRFSVGIKF